MKILIVPLEHSNIEDKFHELLLESFKDNTDLLIYWEANSRNENFNHIDLGLEDVKLLSLFELILFIVVSKDIRLYNDLYEGIGVKTNEFDNIKLSEKVRNIAKGSQAIVNLRKTDEIDTKHFDIEELILKRNDGDIIMACIDSDQEKIDAMFLKIE